MKRVILELFRILAMLLIFRALLGGLLKFIYASIGVHVDGTIGGWFVGFAILILFFVLYRNKFQFSGWYKGEARKKLPKTVSRLLITFSISIFLLVPFVLTVTTDSTPKEKVATISVRSDSAYVNTFEGLDLGILFDFDFTLPHADKSWVNLWVERYIDGEKETQPLTHLSYGKNPNEVEEGQLGFGVINPNVEETLVFLYGPGVRNGPSIIEKEHKAGVFSTWDYAIGDEEVQLEVGETKILAVYRETDSDTVRTIDLQDEHSINEMIKQNNMVLLLKIKIEEN